MAGHSSREVRVIDSHTGGEPTRIVIGGGPDLGSGPLAERRRRFQDQHDGFRAAVVNEPRGSDVLVGGLLCQPHAPSCDAGVIFFNNTGMLNMCGHGTIGLAETLRHLGRAETGQLRIDTPAGVVEAELLGGHRVAVANVDSFRHRAGVTVEVEGHGPVTGDVAWGGNWFFLVEHSPLPLELAEVERLTSFTKRIRRALERAGVTGAEGGLIDHIEVFGPPQAGGHSRSFVLCPGFAYDRSPCGTGTSAKLACLAADGKLAPGEVWRQESILGTVFEASYRSGEDGRVAPTIVGTAHVTAEATLILDAEDPFRLGIPQ